MKTLVVSGGISRPQTPNDTSKIFTNYIQMDKVQQIKELQKLIASDTGDNLKWLVKRLDALLDDKSDKSKNSPRKSNPKKANEKEKTSRKSKEEADKAQSSISLQERNDVFKTVSINPEKVEEIYNNSDGVQDFFNKCIDYVMDNFPKDQDVMNIIKSKSYVQLKVKLEFSHDKPSEPVIGYVRRSFYTQCLHNRSNLFNQ
jgi:hypothetical protein